MMRNFEGWVAAAEAMQSETVELRRAIHREPELGLDTPKTIAKVRQALHGLPLQWKEGRSSSGLVAVLEGASPGRTVLLRGDMDALPMPEDTPLDFRSTLDGAMHACGHDAHTAMLVSAAKMLCERREHIAGRVLFMFQPGEEGHHGARFMIEDGLLDNPKPDAAFALHVIPNVATGHFTGRAGPALASDDTFQVVLRGKGGHASTPSLAVDPIPVACEIVLALQSLITRRVDVFDPVVVTVAELRAGTAHNVIPETVYLAGTIRALSEQGRGFVGEKVRRVIESIAAVHDCTAEIEILAGYPVTLNDARMMALVERVITRTFGAASWTTAPAPVMGAEDFSYVLQRVPGAMIFLGVCPEGQDHRLACPCHSNKMMLSEAALARGVAAHCAVAEAFLTEGWDHAS